MLNYPKHRVEAYDVQGRNVTDRLPDVNIPSDGSVAHSSLARILLRKADEACEAFSISREILPKLIYTPDPSHPYFGEMRYGRFRLILDSQGKECDEHIYEGLVEMAHLADKQASNLQIVPSRFASPRIAGKQYLFDTTLYPEPMLTLLDAMQQQGQTSFIRKLNNQKAAPEIRRFGRIARDTADHLLEKADRLCEQSGISPCLFNVKLAQSRHHNKTGMDYELEFRDFSLLPGCKNDAMYALKEAFSPRKHRLLGKKFEPSSLLQRFDDRFILTGTLQELHSDIGTMLEKTAKRGLRLG
jgi:hypothetical protein